MNYSQGDVPELTEIQLNEGGLYCLLATVVSTSILKVNIKTTKLVYPSNSCMSPSTTSFKIEDYPYLETVTIGDDCFPHVKTVVINNNNALTSISIGANSFTNHRDSYGEDSSRTFSLTNCLKLVSFSIGRFSFSDYRQFKISSNIK